MRLPNPRLVVVALVLVVASVAHAQWQSGGFGVCTESGNQLSPATCSDGAGGMFVTWYDYRNGTTADIYAQRLNGAGVPQWTTGGVAVCVATDDQLLPWIISDGAGGAIVAWHDGRNGGVASADIYAQKLDAAGAPQWTTDGVLICSATRNQFLPRLASDGAGGAIITWYDYRNNFSIPDVYAQRVNSAGVVQWLTDGVEIAVVGGSQIGPRIVSDDAGGAVIVWLDFRSLTHYEVYAQRVTSAGAVQWGANGTVISTAAGNKFNLEMVSDGAGGAIATWQDNRGASADIYAQRVSVAGVALWAGDAAVCTDLAYQNYPTIDTDGANGAVISWEDSRPVSGSDIYAQRIDASGVAQWTTNGVALCTASGAQDRSSTATDGAGGAIVVWQDRRSGDYDLYAQRIDGSGSPQWTADGIVVTTASAEQRAPVAVADGAGGAFLAWQDARNSEHDIFAHRLNGSGSIPTAVGRAPTLTEMTLSPNVPNPFSDQTAFDLHLPRDTDVDIRVYDVTGHLVRRMGPTRPGAGSRRMAFDGRDNRGNFLPSGVYFFRVHAGGETVTRKMVITH
jgi:FlgD Ig-like domain